MRKYAAYMQIYAKFCICSICGIIFAYAILKMPLYVEKYAIFDCISTSLTGIDKLYAYLVLHVAV